MSSGLEIMALTATLGFEEGWKWLSLRGECWKWFESARGVQQGCNLGSLRYSAGSLKILKEFRANPPVPGARAVPFIHDITAILPPELILDMQP